MQKSIFSHIINMNPALEFAQQGLVYIPYTKRLSTLTPSEKRVLRKFEIWSLGCPACGNLDYEHPIPRNIRGCKGKAVFEVTRTDLADPNEYIPWKILGVITGLGTRELKRACNAQDDRGEIEAEKKRKELRRKAKERRARAEAPRFRPSLSFMNLEAHLIPPTPEKMRQIKKEKFELLRKQEETDFFRNYFKGDKY